MPQLANPTRWNSQHDCLWTFIDNYSKYVEILTEHSQEVLANISKILGNVMIYKYATHLLQQLSVVSRVLDHLQADSTYITQAADLWIDFLESPDVEP